mmetsp:Transcript_56042/g.156147  ORF Transcript_56042/g.156147 Transcript_56042/m.156147 type:complete len:112 (-) Transcript_56042:54-389(-)
MTESISSVLGCDPIGEVTRTVDIRLGKHAFFEMAAGAVAGKMRAQCAVESTPKYLPGPSLGSCTESSNTDAVTKQTALTCRRDISKASSLTSKPENNSGRPQFLSPEHLSA